MEFTELAEKIRTKIKVVAETKEKMNIVSANEVVPVNSANVNSCRVIHRVSGWIYKSMQDVFEHADEMYIAPTHDVVFVNFYYQRTPKTRQLMLVVEVFNDNGRGLQYLKMLMAWANQYNVTIKN